MSVVTCFLDALYGRESTLVDAGLEDLIEVVRMADLYDAPVVKQWTANILRFHVSENTASEFLQLAELFQLEALKECVLLCKPALKCELSRSLLPGIGVKRNRFSTIEQS